MKRLLLLLPVAVAAYAYVLQLQEGLIVTGLRTVGQGGSAWGVYIVFDIYFVGVSFAGITVAAMVRLFRIVSLRPISRMAELMTIISLLLAAPCVIADVGRPVEALVDLAKFARPMSPFFGTFTLVAAGYLFASLVYLYLEGRSDAAACAKQGGRFRALYRIWASGYQGTADEDWRHQKASFWLAITILPLLVAAHSTLGFIFGLQGGRPGWFGAIQAPAFVLMAGVSGIGVLIVVAAAARRFLRLQDRIRPETFRTLGNLLWVLIVGTLYLMVVEELTAHYAAPEAETNMAHEIVAGTYAPAFWSVAGSLFLSFVILFVQFARGRPHIGSIVACGILVNIAAVIKRFLIVVPSQTHGLLLDHPEGTYSPTWVEISFILGLAALGAFLFSVFAAMFPLIPSEAAEPVAPPIEPFGRKSLRRVLFGSSLFAGLSLAVLGFLGSARFWSREYLDPAIPWSPVLFIIGVMMAFYSAAVYETLPPTKSPDH